MEWLSENWVFLLASIAFVAMHLFDHGHGRHGGGDREHRRPGSDRERQAPGGLHRH